MTIKAKIVIDCSQSPIFPCDRRDRARLTINGGHLDFYMYRGGGRRGLHPQVRLGTTENQDGRH